MTFTPRFSITNAVASALTQIERARGFLEAATLSEDWIGAMRSRAFLLEAHHTTHIEGTRLTLDEAARVLGGEEVPGADPDDARELLNYRRAFEFVSTATTSSDSLPSASTTTATGWLSTERFRAYVKRTWT